MQINLHFYVNFLNIIYLEIRPNVALDQPSFVGTSRFYDDIKFRFQ